MRSNGKCLASVRPQTRNTNTHKLQTQREKESKAWCSEICHLKISIVDLHANRLRHSGARLKQKQKYNQSEKCASHVFLCSAESMTSPRLRLNGQTEKDVRYSNFVRIFNLSSVVAYVVDAVSHSFVRSFTFIHFVFFLRQQSSISERNSHIDRNLFSWNIYLSHFVRFDEQIDDEQRERQNNKLIASSCSILWHFEEFSFYLSQRIFPFDLRVSARECIHRYLWLTNARLGDTLETHALSAENHLHAD